MYRGPLGPLLGAIFIAADLIFVGREFYKKGVPDEPYDSMVLMVALAAALYAMKDIVERIKKLKEPLIRRRMRIGFYFFVQSQAAVFIVFGAWRIWHPLAIITGIISLGILPYLPPDLQYDPKVDNPKNSKDE